MSTIGYHTRRKSDGVRLSGGSFGGRIDQETVERLTRLFECRALPNGHVTFVDRNGVDVWLHIAVDAAKTEKGKAALLEYRATLLEYRKVVEDRALALQKEQEALEDLLGTMTAAEAIERLTR